MPAAATPKRPRLKPRLWKLSGVRVFAAGKARGQEWTEADIDAMVANGAKYADVIRPTAVIGHEEKQPLAGGVAATVKQNTGEPAFGRVENLRKEKAGGQTYLAADFADVPTWLAKLVAGKQYRSVSAEIYEQPPDGCEGAEGPILRRVALLGGELPQIKTLGDLPEPEFQAYTESGVPVPRRPLRVESVRRRRRVCVVRFSEAPVKTCKSYAALSEKSKATMKRFADDAPAEGGDAPAAVSRQDLLDMLADMGVDTAALKDCPDEALAEIARVLSSQVPADDDKPTEPAPDDNRMSGSDELRGKNQDGQRRAIWAKDPEGDYHPSKHTYAGDDESATNAPAEPAMPANQPSRITVQFSEPVQQAIAAAVKMALDAQKGDIAQIKRFTESEKASRKRADVTAFCEAQVKAGKLLPAEIDGGVVEMAMGLDAATVVKFSDGKHETALDRWKRTVEARPVLVSFAERLKGGKPADPNAGDEDRIRAHVMQFSELYGNYSPDRMVEGFRAARKANPKYTVEEHLGIRSAG